MINNIKNYFPLYLLFFTPFLLTIGIAIVEFSVLFLIIFFFIKNRDISYYKDQNFYF